MQFDVNTTKTPLSAWVPLARGGSRFIVHPWYNSSENVFIKQVMEAAACTESKGTF